ncbi:MAG TPA: DUF397 domain-containing protein [Streptosporangiaceae bacterium]
MAQGRYSISGTNNCVEGSTASHVVAVRDSKDPSGPVLIMAPEAWRAFTARVKASH